jgi:hypothetical protein
LHPKLLLLDEPASPLSLASNRPRLETLSSLSGTGSSNPSPSSDGVNIVSGWHKIEYSQMGLWPGDDHFGKRYDYSTEYVRVMLELWENGHSDFQGEYFMGLLA